eukprot:5445959-Pleurochrysis_carterae.AAC.1
MGEWVDASAPARPCAYCHERTLACIFKLLRRTRLSAILTLVSVHCLAAQRARSSARLSTRVPSGLSAFTAWDRTRGEAGASKEACSAGSCDKRRSRQAERITTAQAH